MVNVPRQRLEELLLEASLTFRPHLVVEGPDDERFYRAWAVDAEVDRVVFSSVEDLEVPTGLVIELGLTDGNRGRVVAAAKVAAERNVPIRCIADRDCGHHVGEHDYDTLLWTDYPAIESYALDEATLDRANALGMAGRLPPANDLLPGLSFALREIFAVRQKHENLEAVNHASGLPRRSSDLSRFDVARAVSPAIDTQAESCPRSASGDPRTYGYGHDIADLLLVAFGNALKNQAGLLHRRAVEGALRSAIQVVGTYRTEPMFARLESWCAERLARAA